MTENIFERVREKNLIFLTPRKALNKAFLKIKPSRNEIEKFKIKLITLLDRIDDTESEEFHKNLISDFLKKTYYDPKHFINTKGRNDLVIHNGQNTNSTVGVIIEAKKITNKAEMITPENINKKAFQELVLYYLRERITHKNLKLKHLIATNINEWFIFDANLFDRLFAQNKELIKQCEDFENNRLVEKTTDFFYKQIAEPFIESIISEIEFTYFNIQDYQKPLRNADKADDNLLIALFKLLSPEHLLKLPFINDSNTLDRGFYNELLHIMGLTEVKEANKKLIKRNKPSKRHSGSILESVIVQLDSLNKLGQIQNINQFGDTNEERLFNIGLELTITWINRILFLKLLEAQLLSYHKGDKSYSFLNLNKIKNYDELNSLFFQVLAKPYEDRNEDVRKIFEKIPYLNSSLFELTELENKTLVISNLQYNKTIPIFAQTIIKDQQGKKRAGNLNTLEYLFEFLNAYDFGAEGSEEIQEENKTLITASVLGLIFEKINGYKDGSFFTPSFITSYMCRETIHKAVVQKFNEIKKWNCTSIEELYDKIEDRKEANKIINSIKICDPAVGSGHFLVSSLNEMIAIKSNLKILQDREGKRLKEYQIKIENDELNILDEDGELFKYNPKNKESQRIQESLFHEKQKIIENCLFGVDINPNSVKICRLRLWIELLKNAYYKNDTELETLPNIDINIKCGNSLISRFTIDANLKSILKSRNISIDEYKKAIKTYQNTTNREEKREVKKFIESIRKNFKQELLFNHPVKTKLNNLEGELFNIQQDKFPLDLGAESDKRKKENIKKQEQLKNEIIKVKEELENLENNTIYDKAFEWRFEFPEVLDESGNFIGFNVVIGNPPYIRQEEIKEIKPYLKDNYVIFNSIADIYTYFIERANSVLNTNGHFAFIISNKFTKANYGENLKNYLLKNTQLNSFIDFSGIPVFDNAVVDAAILSFRKKPQFNPQPPERGLLENENKNIVKEYTPELLDKTGHLKYNRELISLAKQNRNNPTKAEKHIWDNILSNQKIGYKFIQQKTILNFILDFYCSELLLGIEIDGEYHEEREYQDSVRSEELEKAKIKIIRYKNEDVLNNINFVKEDLSEQINKRIQELSFTPPPPLKAPFQGIGGVTYCNIQKDFLEKPNAVAEYIQKNKINFPISQLEKGNWAFANDEKLQIKQKVESQGKPLKDWDIEINYGIKTGFNEAFVIDKKKKNELIAKDPKCAEIIKPLLRGRDIQKWKPEFADLWLILIPAGWTNKNQITPNPLKGGYKSQSSSSPLSGDLGVEEQFFANYYPSIYEHFIELTKKQSKGKGLFQRDDQGDYWWELRHCAYYDKFEKPKIVYPVITQEMRFSFDLKDYFYFNDKCFMITGSSIKYLIAYFHSKLFAYCFKRNFPGLGTEGIELRKVFFEQIPVKIPSPEQEKKIIDLVEKILTQAPQPPKGGVLSVSGSPFRKLEGLEKQIDLMVYELYDLTEEEIQLIEESK